MTPRSFFRWKSFWLGALVVVFLGWAWWDSSFMRAGATWYPSPASYSIGHQECRINGSCFHGKRHPLKPLWQTYREEIDQGYSGPRFPPAVRTTENTIEIAYWFLVLLFLIPWSAFLAWRWRRMSRFVATGD